jgi:DNA-binding transcriptional LysR family regulator
MAPRPTGNKIDFDLRQLEIFCKILELKSFSKAAESIGLSQASVSERMANLEKKIGVKLFDRLGREIQPNKIGKLLYQQAKKLLEMKQRTCLELEEFLDIHRGDIKIGGSTIPGEYILPKILGSFKNQYPDITVKLQIADSNEISIQVSEGVLELGIVGSKSKIKCLTYKKLWEDELVLAVSSSHRWSSKNPISIKELSQEPFIFRESGSGTKQMIEDLLKSKADLSSFTIVAELGSSTAIKEGLKHNLGISFISKRAISSEIKAKTLKIIPVKGLSFDRYFYLVQDRRRSLSPLGRVFIDFLSKDNTDVE